MMIGETTTEEIEVEVIEVEAIEVEEIEAIGEVGEETATLTPSTAQIIWAENSTIEEIETLMTKRDNSALVAIAVREETQKLAKTRKLAEREAKGLLLRW